MSLPSSFPLYPDPLLLKYQVSLSFPMIGYSEISKSIGITASYPFLTPNIDYIKKFVEGDLGITDSIYKTYYDNNKVNDKFRLLNQIPSDNGLKALEKTMLKSLYETQKPYIEIAKIMVNQIATLEDVIARVMPLLGVPLKTKSLKPKYNNGSDNRPKAIGYDKTDSFSQLDTKINIDNEGNITDTNTTTNNINKKYNNWKIISTIYSTIEFIPNVNYKYSYIDLPSDEQSDNIKKQSPEAEIDHKPEIIVLGVYDSNGVPLNPNTTPWLLESGKWFLSDNYIWPTLYAPIYKWSKGNDTMNSPESPGEDWVIIKDIKGNPIITEYDSSVKEYNDFFINKIDKKLLSKNDPNIDKETLKLEILNKINQTEYIDNITKYSQLNSLYTKEPPIKKIYKPYNINIDNKKVWIDPEVDYKLKIIEIKPNDIVYPEGNSILSTNTPYSNSNYGRGTEEEPQSTDILTRYKNMSNDTEIYYIVEGIKNDSELNVSTSTFNNDNIYYKLPNAIGAPLVLADALIDISVDLIPTINNTIKLLKKPSEFIINILTEKIKESYSIFNNESKKIYDLSKSKTYKESKYIIKNSPLYNHVFNHKKSVEFLLGGIGLISFKIFDKKIDLGFEINFDKPNIFNVKKNKDDDTKEQPLLKFLLGIITTPLKIIAKILEYILNFFKSLAIPSKLPNMLKDFLSFKWIMDIFDPTSILKLTGIEINLDKLKKIMEDIKLPNLKDQEIDLNEIINIPFLIKLPKYKLKHLNMDKSFITKLLNPAISLIESIVNAIIDLLWSILGLEALIKPKHLDIKNKISETISNINNIENTNNTIYTYDITTDDETLYDLTYQELMEFINNNPDLNFNYSF